MTRPVEATGSHGRPVQSFNLGSIEYWQDHLSIPPEFHPESCGIPTLYRECTLDNFQGNPSLIASLRKYSGGGLLIFGNTGVGKTHLAVGLMRELDRKQWISRCQINIQRLSERKKPITRAEKPRPGKQFVTVPELLFEIRKSFNVDSNFTEERVLDRFSNVRLLVLDDLGSGKASDFALDTLCFIIDRRYREQRDTIITSNLSLDQIEDRLNARIASRLASWELINITMPDFRKKTAQGR